MSVALGKRKRQGEAGKTATKAAYISAVKGTTKLAAKSATTKPLARPGTALKKAEIAPARLAQPIKPERAEESDDEDVRAIFQRAFEAKFRPIEVKKAGGADKSQHEDDSKDDEEEIDHYDDDDDDGEIVSDGENDEDEDEDESDFDGLSEHEDKIEVVEVVDTRRVANERLDKKQMKAFMSAKPPSSDSIPISTNKQPKPPKDGDKTEDDGTDAANLKNDLALQRLLNESHLLDSSFSSTDPSGKNRHKATDLRLMSLGSKGSVLEQKNMPLAHRKGINAKKAMKETERRREAKENGVILERAALKRQSNTSGPAEKRARGIGGPSVGRFSGGTLRLSKQDVAGITGPKRTSTGKKGGKSSRSGSKSKW